MTMHFDLALAGVRASLNSALRAYADLNLTGQVGMPAGLFISPWLMSELGLPIGAPLKFVDHYAVEYEFAVFPVIDSCGIVVAPIRGYHELGVALRMKPADLVTALAAAYEADRLKELA